jgi:uncharacterized protein YndB with AHSA1/START domain
MPTTETLKVSSLIAASPNRIYSAWMDERHHSAFTGSRATVDPWVGGRLTAKDGYINATHIRLETGARIVMTWRTADFPLEMPDSQVDVELEAVAGGTRINILHEGIPEGQAPQYKDLWRAQYLDPMKRFFSKPAAARAALRAASKAGLLPPPSLTNTRPAGRIPVGPAPALAGTRPSDAPIRPAKPSTPTTSKAKALAKARARTAATLAARASGEASKKTSTPPTRPVASKPASKPVEASKKKPAPKPAKKKPAPKKKPTRTGTHASSARRKATKAGRRR